MATTGMELRDAGTEAVIAADHAVHRGAGEWIKDTIAEFAASGAEFSAEDVRWALRDNADVLRELYHRPNLLPAYFGSMASKGVIKPVSMCRPSRSTRRASRNLVWVGARC